MYCLPEKEYDTHTERCVSRVCFFNDNTKESYLSCTNLDKCYSLIYAMFFSLFGLLLLTLIKNLIEYCIVKSNLILVKYDINKYSCASSFSFMVLLVINFIMSMIIINTGPLKDFEDPSEKQQGFNCIIWYILIPIIPGTLIIFFYFHLLSCFYQIFLELFIYTRTYFIVISENEEEI